MSGDFDCLLNFLAMGRVLLYVKPKSVQYSEHKVKIFILQNFTQTYTSDVIHGFQIHNDKI